ncbi:MAG: hypothetical protein M0R22_07545 [Dehalococcoidia bacterium]|jgi:hypothetical protein|nr:hypothetical protein [Dehalococcoidia bacterium]
MSEDKQVVWLVWDYGWGDDVRLWGVYSTRELAEAASRAEGGPYSPKIRDVLVDGGIDGWVPS